MLIVAGVMLAYNWLLALVAFAVSMPLAFVLRAVQRDLVRAYDAARDATATCSAPSPRWCRARRRSAPTAPGRCSSGGCTTRSRSRRDAQIRAALIGAFLFPSGEVFSVFTVAAIVGVGVWMGPSSGLTAGALVGFIFLTYRFLEPIAEFTEVLDQTQTAVAGLRRVLGVLDIPIGPPPPTDPVALPAARCASTSRT